MDERRHGSRHAAGRGAHPGEEPAVVPEITAAVDGAGSLFFVVRRLGEPGSGLWRSDGTPEGTVRLTLRSCR